MKDFALFILSHNRANKIDALNLLKKSNYNGDWFVVISTDNTEISEYKKIVPYENLLIFDKNDVLCDTMMATKNFIANSALYARNFIIGYALNKYKFFSMVDDDVSDLYFRFDKDGHMHVCKANFKLEEICNDVCQMLNKSKKLAGIGFKNYGGYFGGVNALERYDREIQQFMFFKSENCSLFKGIFWEDAILSCCNLDKLYITFPTISAKSPQLGTNDGGVNYEKNKYPPGLFWYIACPSALKLEGISCTRIRYNKNMYPKIINQKYKKL